MKFLPKAPVPTISSRRTRRDIIHAILTIAMEPVNRTAIIYGAYLNSKRGKRYIDKLIGDGFLAVVEGKYVATEEGLEERRQIRVGYRLE